jgi:hypothetical protein
MLLSMLSGCECKHDWAEANCGAPKTCTRCGVTEGEKVGEHTWMDATTDAPKTCSVCGETTGKKIETDYRFQTSKCKEIFGTWEGYYKMDATEYGIADYQITMKLTMSFAYDGFMKMTAELQDPGALALKIAANSAAQVYGTCAMFGLTHKDVDELYQAEYGKSVTEYFAEQAMTTLEAANSSAIKVYYVDEGKIHIAEHWNRPMESDGYEMKDGKLLLDDKDLGQIVEFTRVSE